MSWAQLITVTDRKAVRRALRSGYLRRVLPGVFAVGHHAPSVEGALAAALLYAGPGAMLSHATAAWWWGLIDHRPALIHVSTPRDCRSPKGIRVHSRRTVDRVWHKGLPVTNVPQTLLDYAVTADPRRLRRALAEADYRRLVTRLRLEATLKRGKPGSRNLRRAIDHHQPRLAYTRSPLEEQLIEICERHRLPLPLVNVRVEGYLVDAFWPAHKLVVELDGGQAHATPARMRADRARDLALRTAGYTVIRYSASQVEDQPDLIAAELARLLPAGSP